MTDNPCNCATCTNESCKYFKYKGVSRSLSDGYGFMATPSIITPGCGCLSHPLALEYLMRDVIEGLQYIVSEVDSANDWETSLKQIREKAIALIKGERK